MGDFRGFPAWGVRFYGDLERDNTRDFWAGHKAQWEAEVRHPMRALLDELEPEFGEARLFRPYRDVRFSADKSPYKTHQGALAGPKPGVGYYVQISSEGLTVGGGFRTHSPAQTEQFRDAVVDEASGPELESIVTALVSAGFTLEGATLKTRPRGFPAEHARMDLLRRKELMAIRHVGTPAWLETPVALEHVRASWRQIRPLADWVQVHIDMDAGR
jgi:uncharacterized protein (TIGR02453 family)